MFNRKLKAELAEARRAAEYWRASSQAADTLIHKLSAEVEAHHAAAKARKAMLSESGRKGALVTNANRGRGA